MSLRKKKKKENWKFCMKFHQGLGLLIGALTDTM
jgi:hypothetical protein